MRRGKNWPHFDLFKGVWWIKVRFEGVFCWCAFYQVNFLTFVVGLLNQNWSFLRSPKTFSKSRSSFWLGRLLNYIGGSLFRDLNYSFFTISALSLITILMIAGSLFWSWWGLSRWRWFFDRCSLFHARTFQAQTLFIKDQDLSPSFSLSPIATFWGAHFIENPLKILCNPS